MAGLSNCSYKSGNKKRLWPENCEPCFESRFEELVIESGKSQRQFAKTIMTCEQNISYWIRGIRYPDLGTFITICEKYDVSSDWLLGFKESRKI